MRKDVILGMLPDPFIFRDGTRVNSLSDWDKRREEIIEDKLRYSAVLLSLAVRPVRTDLRYLQGSEASATFRSLCRT